jgi:acyl-CoA thioesterase FadM
MQNVRRNAPDGDVVCEGSAEVACMDARGGKPRRFPLNLLSEFVNE